MTAIIVAEYNPFHAGHLYQIRQIRARFGTSCAVAVVMSGNYTQRGEVAIADKFLRAKIAVQCGADLVVELPFPYCCASAPLFADAGISIADRLGIAHVCVFGSESGNLSVLQTVSEQMGQPIYERALREIMRTMPQEGYPYQRQLAYEKAFGQGLSQSFFAPNNLLALEYLRAMRESGSSMSAHTICRIGAGYHDADPQKTYASAAAVRAALQESPPRISDSLPSVAKEALTQAIKQGQAPCLTDRLSGAVLSSFRCNPPRDAHEVHDAQGGLYNRLLMKSQQASDLSSLIRLTETKKFTRARIRRAILYSLFGVTSSDIKDMPRYTQLLAMNRTGQSLLRTAKQKSRIEVLTKPSRLCDLSCAARRQKELSDRADSVFVLSKPNPTPGNTDLCCTPYLAE